MVEFPWNIWIDAAQKVAAKHQAALEELAPDVPWEKRHLAEAKWRTAIAVLDTMEIEYEQREQKEKRRERG